MKEHKSILNKKTLNRLKPVEIVRECNERGLPMTERKLQLYATRRIISHPFYEPTSTGRQSYFGIETIDELSAVHELKLRLSCSLSEIAALAANKSATLKEIVDKVNALLDHLYSLYRGKNKNAYWAIMYMADPFPRKVVKLFLRKIKEGANLKTFDYERFVNEAFDEIKG